VNYSRIALAGVGATVVYFVLGFLLFVLSPLADEYRQFPAVYHAPESMKGVAPVGMVGTLVSMVAWATLYALAYRNGSPVAEGARFGFLVGVFALGSFVLHNYVNLNIGLKLTLGQAFAYFIQWIVAGITIALIYRPAHRWRNEGLPNSVRIRATRRPNPMSSAAASRRTILA
jgi:hypothetical protein